MDAKRMIPDVRSSDPLSVFDDRARLLVAHLVAPIVHRLHLRNASQHAHAHFRAGLDYKARDLVELLDGAALSFWKLDLFRDLRRALSGRFARAAASEAAPGSRYGAEGQEAFAVALVAGGCDLLHL